MAGPPKSVVSIVQPKRVSFRVALSGIEWFYPTVAYGFAAAVARRRFF